MITLIVNKRIPEFLPELTRINIPALLQNEMSVKMAINYNFEWDPGKARDNRDKHAVTFDEAATVFKDSKALLRSELFQAGKHQNKKSKHMVNEHEKRV